MVVASGCSPVSTPLIRHCLAIIAYYHQTIASTFATIANIISHVAIKFRLIIFAVNCHKSLPLHVLPLEKLP